MSRAQPLRAAVFDLDGTLVDSMPLVLRAIAHAIEPFAARPEAEIFSHLGGPPERFLRTLVTHERHVPAAITRLAAYDRDNVHLVTPFAGVQRFLGQLRAGGVQTAIWTGRDRGSTEPMLAKHGLAEVISFVVCGDDFPTHKPDPAGLRAILSQLGVAAAETIFVGDADVDVLGGVACGVDTVLIRHGRPVADDVVAKAWRAVESPAEAFELVRARLNRGGTSS